MRQPVRVEDIDDFLFGFTDPVPEGLFVSGKKVREGAVVSSPDRLLRRKGLDVAFHFGEKNMQNEVQLSKIFGLICVERPQSLIPEAPVQDAAERKHDQHRAERVQDEQFGLEFHFGFTSQQTLFRFARKNKKPRTVPGTGL
jgi:hypothetical protein